MTAGLGTITTVGDVVVVVVVAVAAVVAVVVVVVVAGYAYIGCCSVMIEEDVDWELESCTFSGHRQHGGRVLYLTQILQCNLWKYVCCLHDR